MEIPKQCPICQSSIKLIPAGVSKRTGKPYNEFYACSNRTCDYIYREGQPIQPQASRLDSLAIYLKDEFKKIHDKLDFILNGKKEPEKKDEYMTDE